jgi:hypothetical protein
MCPVLTVLVAVAHQDRADLVPVVEVTDLDVAEMLTVSGVS